MYIKVAARGLKSASISQEERVETRLQRYVMSMHAPVCVGVLVCLLFVLAALWGGVLPTIPCNSPAPLNLARRDFREETASAKLSLPYYVPTVTLVLIFISRNAACWLAHLFLWFLLHLLHCWKASAHLWLDLFPFSQEWSYSPCHHWDTRSLLPLFWSSESTHLLPPKTAPSSSYSWAPWL